MKDISIIVPFFNSAAYLRRCVSSLCHQTISKQLEIVFVDDCSSDNSEDVIKSTLSELNFTGDVVFERHASNQGSAIARRTGIEASNGTFILFCDSDDWIERDMCEKMLDKAERDNCDIVVCDYNKETQSTIVHVKNCFSENFLSELLKCSITGSLCNKLIKRSLFNENGFVYPTLAFSEDYVMTFQVSYYAKIIGYIPEPLYNYAYNSNSITQQNDLQRVTKRMDEDLENYMLLEHFMEKKGIIAQFPDEIIFHKLKMKNYIRGYFRLNRHFLKRWRNTFPELNYQILFCKLIGFRQVLSYYATYLGAYTGK